MSKTDVCFSRSVRFLFSFFCCCCCLRLMVDVGCKRCVLDDSRAMQLQQIKQRTLNCGMKRGLFFCKDMLCFDIRCSAYSAFFLLQQQNNTQIPFLFYSFHISPTSGSLIFHPRFQWSILAARKCLHIKKTTYFNLCLQPRSENTW